MGLACENIRFSSLFAAEDVSRGEEPGETDVFAGYVGHEIPQAAQTHVAREGEM